MRTDPGKSETFIKSGQWNRQKYANSIVVKNENGAIGFSSNSFSGNESNKFFLSREGSKFANLSLISGLDSLADGRSFAILDFDRDGWQDVALISTNRPRFQLFRNQISSLDNSGRKLQIKLEGQSDRASSSSAGNRDAIGAKLVAQFESGRTLKLQKQAGEGNVAQNSENIWLGFREKDRIKRLTVFWPSGVLTTVDNPTKDGNSETVLRIKETVNTGNAD